MMSFLRGDPVENLIKEAEKEYSLIAKLDILYKGLETHKKALNIDKITLRLMEIHRDAETYHKRYTNPSDEINTLLKTCTNPILLIEQAEFQTKCGHVELAIKCLDKAFTIEIDPKLSTFLIEKAELHLGSHSTISDKYLNKALEMEIDPKLSTFLIEKAELHVENLEISNKFLDKAFTMEIDPMLLIKKAEFQIQSKNLELANKFLGKAFKMELDPKLSTFLIEKAKSHTKNKNLDIALKYLEQAFKMDKPTGLIKSTNISPLSQCFNSLALAFYRKENKSKDDFANAIDCMEKAIRLHQQGVYMEKGLKKNIETFAEAADEAYPDTTGTGKTWVKHVEDLFKELGIKEHNEKTVAVINNPPKTITSPVEKQTIKKAPTPPVPTNKPPRTNNENSRRTKKSPPAIPKKKPFGSGFTTEMEKYNTKKNQKSAPKTPDNQQNTTPRITPNGGNKN